MLRRLLGGGHTRLEAQLSAYLDGELSPAERRRLEEHLAGCASCRARLGELERTVGLLRALPAVRPPRSFRLSPAMVGAAPAPTPALRWSLLPMATAVSALLLLAVVGVDLSAGPAALPAPRSQVLEAPAAAPRAADQAEAPQPEAAPMTAPQEAEPAAEAGEEAGEEAAVTAEARREPEREPAPAAIPKAEPETPLDGRGAARAALRGLELGLLVLTLLLAALTWRLRSRR